MANHVIRQEINFLAQSRSHLKMTKDTSVGWVKRSRNPTKTAICWINMLGLS
ncbi:MAG: hypothetical protein F6K39_29615 [Okeania sp. SIO3B3]|nr:hypothetical protein [Okeania sp. SIO3B3]